MKNEPLPTNEFSPVGPIVILGLTIAIFFSWQVVAGVRQHLSGIRIGQQLDALAIQAEQAEINLRAVMMDLITLAESDAEASKIVRKFNIKFTSDESANPKLDMPLGSSKLILSDEEDPVESGVSP